LSHTATKFLVVLLIGLGLVVIQGVLAWGDGFLSKEQIKAIYGLDRAYSFLQHGGMWADVLIVVPIVAWIISRYDVSYLSKPGLITLGVILAVVIVAGVFFRNAAEAGIPEAHTRGGKTTPAGIVHGVFALGMAWTMLLYYFGGVEPRAGADMLVISSALTIWALMGVMKFNPIWAWDKTAITIVLIEIGLIWAVTVFRFKP